MIYSPVLFFHCVDANILNAQSNNTKAILARWDAANLPATVFHFSAPDPAVAANPYVRLIKLPPNRLWKARALAAGLGRFSAVYYPGFSAQLDDKVRRMRQTLGRGGVVISTLEGLPANAHSLQTEEARLSTLAGHKVFCQSVAPADMKALNRMKGSADLIIGISPFLQRMAAQMWPGRDTADLPLGVNLGCFHSDGRVPHGCNPKIRVVSAGNFHKSKRPNMFLDFAHHHTQANFTWFGDGPMRGPLLAQAKAEGVKNVFFPGPVEPSALASAFRRADLFTLPSTSEGVPKVIQEAAACGLPVVCMNYYETNSVVHGVNGFQAHDDVDYGKQLDRLINDADLRARMGAASSELARGWDWNDLAPRWQALIWDKVQIAGGRSAL